MIRAEVGVLEARDKGVKAGAPPTTPWGLCRAQSHILATRSEPGARVPPLGKWLFLCHAAEPVPGLLPGPSPSSADLQFPPL